MTAFSPSRKISPEESLARIQGGGRVEGGDLKPIGPPPLPEKQEKQEFKNSTFGSRPPKYKLEDIVLSALVKQEVDTLLSRIANHHVIYDEWEFGKVDPQGKNVAVNFYGLPGTGKTMLAEALASCLGKEIIEVNYAEIESKYVGETAKNIVAAFKNAREMDAVLFFDEADSILGKRLTNVTQSADHGVNVSRSVMLKQMDDFAGVVVFATNLAKNFDTAFVRRILQHINVLPPDEAGRKLLWNRMISLKVPGHDHIDFDSLAKLSHELTGGQIKNATLLALSKLATNADPKRRLVLQDLSSAIDSVKQAHRDVGEGGTGWSEVSPISAIRAAK